jgi:hypothetical protein
MLGIIHGRPFNEFLFSVNALVCNEECFQPGECKESFLFARYVAADEFECLQYCKAEDGCAWFTFRPETPG